MLASLDKASPEVQADPQHAVSKAQLQELQSASSKERNQWNTALAKWPATWAVAAGFENEAEKVEEVKLEKSKCEQSLKELNKVLPRFGPRARALRSSSNRAAAGCETSQP